MGQISKNTFSKGLNRDYDPTNVNSSSMVDNINGRLMFNKRGTLDWVEDNGNKLTFTLNGNSGNDTERYAPIGYCGDGNIKIIFSVKEDLSASEIGILGTDKDGQGTYKTLFNDTLDTNKLSFNPENEICARFLYENNEKIRVYWVDGIKKTTPKSNPPRVYTFKYDVTTGLSKNNVNAYSTVTTSVHNINSQPDFNIGIVKFVENIAGSLLTGVYQYAYRLLTIDGYVTPWTIPTKKIFVTSDVVDGDNSPRYEMEGSGESSSKGIKIEIKGIDVNYKRIEIVYLYSKTTTVVDSSNIFLRTEITGSTMTFEHTSNDGVPVVAATIAEKFQAVSSAKTLDIKDNVLYYGNINENRLSITDEEIEAVLVDLTISPKFRDMPSDKHKPNNQNYDSVGAQPPLVRDQDWTDVTTNKRLNQSSLETYSIKNDYANYNGTQVEHLFTGYFRGEVYRFGIVFYDKVGNPYFAFHLADFLFPDQYSTSYEWRRLKQDGTIRQRSAILTQPAVPTNDFHNTNLLSDYLINNTSYYNTGYSDLRIMGIEVGGLDLSGIADRISGFSIVRTDRNKSILHQGLILPNTFDPDDGRTRPWPVSHMRIGAAGSYPGEFELFGIKGSNGQKFRIKPNDCILHAPDVDFDVANNLPVVTNSDRLKIVGSCYKQCNAGDNSFNRPNYTFLDQNPNGDDNAVMITKWYRTFNNYHNNVSGTFAEIRPSYGMTAKITHQYNLNINQSLPNYRGSTDFDNATQFETDSAPNTEGYGNSTEFAGGGKPNSILYRHLDFTGGLTSDSHSCAFNYNSGSTLTTGTQSGALICNYTRNGDNIAETAYGGLTASSLSETIFYSTGHFQPINNTAFTTPSSNIYNQIEIFGGDCYLNYFGFARIYPRIRSGASGNSGVGYGIVFPLESENNYSLRQSNTNPERMYTDVSIRPGGTPSIWTNGLFYTSSTNNRLEIFNYNDVINFSELTTFFTGKPIDFDSINEFPIRWRHTKTKYYGDPIDTWRQFEVNKFQDLKGVYGPITSSSFLFNQIYSFQETGFGRLRAFDRAALESETTQSLTTGIGPALDGVDYVSTSVGNQNQWSLVNTGKAFYWIDVYNGKAMRFAQDGLSYLSDLRGMHYFFAKESSFFLNKDNPINNNGILGVWNSKDREVLWTFNRDEYFSINYGITINSDLIDNEFYYGNNETVFINWQGVSGVLQGIALPAGNSQFGNNTNIIQYISLKSTSNAMGVKQYIGSGSSGLVLIQPGENYMFYRDSSTDVWSYTLLTDKSKITPFRATVVYSEYIESFSQFHSFKPNFYISHNKFLISEQASLEPKKYYVHGKNELHANYYGQNWKTSLKVTVSDQGEFSKLFDNVRVAVNKQGVDKMSKFIFSTEQQKHFYDVQSDTRVRFLEDNFRMPIRTQNQLDRMRGRWLSMIFEFQNNTSYSIKIDNLINHYRLSNRK